MKTPGIGATTVFSNSLSPLRLNLNVYCHRLADAGDRFSRCSKHQIEVTPRDRVGGHRPACPSSLVNGGQQFHVKGDRLGHAVHGQLARNIATLRSGAFYAPAFKCDPGKFLDIKKFRAAQVIIALFDLRIDATHLDLRSDGGILRMFAIDFDLAAEIRELAVSRSEELMHTKADRRTRRAKLVILLGRSAGANRSDHERCDDISNSHCDIFFVLVASVFKSGVRERGSRPNKFPSAKAGLVFNRV